MIQHLPSNTQSPSLPVTRFAAVDISDPLERMLVQGVSARPEVEAMIDHKPMRCPVCESALVEILGVGLIADDRMTVWSHSGHSEIEGLAFSNPGPAASTVFQCNLGHRWARVERCHKGMVFTGCVILKSHASITSLAGKQMGVLAS